MLGVLFFDEEVRGQDAGVVDRLDGLWVLAVGVDVAQVEDGAEDGPCAFAGDVDVGADDAVAGVR